MKHTILLAMLCLANPSQAADINQGRELFIANCAGCHGQRGEGLLPGTPNFRQGNLLMRPDAVLVEGIRTGRNTMPGFRGVLTDRQLLDVVAYLRTLQ